MSRKEEDHFWASVIAIGPGTIYLDESGRYTRMKRKIRRALTVELKKLRDTIDRLR